MDQNFKMNQSEKSESQEIETRFRKLIGPLMYATIATRPDLAIAVSILSRYQHCATNELWIALKRVLRYIKGTLNMKLIYKREQEKSVFGYVDADWGGDINDRKSTTGYVFKVFNNVVSWCSRKQSVVSLSSTEAEYVALSFAACEASWLRSLMTELGLMNNKSEATVIFQDNQSAIRIAKNPEQHKRLKHVDIKYHFVRNKVLCNEIDVKYIPTNEQLADVFTKPLVKQKLDIFCKMLNLL